MDNQALCALMLLCSICWATGARGDVLRWDTNTVIPGTENIEPGPGVQLDHRELSHALLSDLDLTGANFKLSNLRSARVRSSVLDNANFSGANLTFAFLDSQLTNADLSGANLTDAYLMGADLTSANLAGANLERANLWSTTLTNADFTGAVIRNASLGDTTSRGFTREQLYSTGSYQAKTLQGIALYQNNLAGWDLSGQDLVTADLQLSNLAGADLGGADLRQANLHSTNLTDANLSGANLARAFLWRSTFNRANVAGAIIHEADLREATLRGFTKEHLYSTGSYQAKVLRLIKFGTSNFAGWDFSGQDLLGVSFYASNLTESNLAGANLLAAAMSGANLSRSMLTNANLDLAMLSLANLTHAKLSGATLDRTDLSWADLRLVEGFDPVESTILTNTILPDGTVDGLQLSAFQTLRATAGVPLPLGFIGEFALVPNATIELNDNVAIVDYPGDTPVDTVRQRILAGRGGPGWGATWNGRGITSSTAATANSTDAESRSVGYAENTALPLGPYNAFDGVPVDGSSVLIAYTRTADANLDGVVSDDDVTILSAFYAPGVANPNWALGDFDYNGFVDDDDVTLLGAFYDPSAPPIMGTPAGVAGPMAAVPEPATAVLLGVMLVASAMVLIRRRNS